MFKYLSGFTNRTQGLVFMVHLFYKIFHSVPLIFVVCESCTMYLIEKKTFYSFFLTLNSLLYNGTSINQTQISFVYK